MTKFLMIQGTSSNAGKSSIVAALCRIFSDKGYKVAPLKAQNMSSNLFITEDGLEMAEAQAIQAIASRTEPSVYMNPILLKPMGDYVSRVVLHGKTYRDMHAKYYYNNFVTKRGMRYVKDAIKKLSKYDLVIIEGAGSPAEINIMDYDIANMKLAEMLNAPVLIIADIERGGCFASIVGTMELLKQEHRKLVKGFIINKFRGDKTILGSAISTVEKTTNKPVLGIIPFIENMLLPNEDSLGIDSGTAKSKSINIAIVKYPNAINITDFDPLLQSSAMSNTLYVTSHAKLSDADLILLPSSRNLTADLRWMKKNGLFDAIRSLRKKPIVGICEGYAMMGKQIHVNGKTVEGLNLLDTRVYSDRRLAGNVDLKIVSKKAIIPSNGKMLKAHLRADYRIVNGKNAYPLFSIVKLNGKKRKFAEGSISKDGLAFGCCIYGLFDTHLVRNALLKYISRKKKMRVAMHEMDARTFWDKQIQKFSNKVKNNIDMEKIMELVN